MKIETTELVAAAHVLEIAKELQQNAWLLFAAENGHDPLKWSGSRSLWLTTNPTAGFVPQAVTLLSGVALQIRSVTSTSAQ